MATDYRALAAQFAARSARAHGLDPQEFARIFLRQINQESGFNPTARSSAGAEGIAQIVPRYHPEVDPSDPVASLRWSADYMAGLVKKYGSYAPALSVYNSGRPDKYKDPNFAGGQTYNYVRKILGGHDVAAPAQPNAAPSAAPAAPAGFRDALNQAGLTQDSIKHMLVGQLLSQAQGAVSGQLPGPDSLIAIAALRQAMTAAQQQFGAEPQAGKPVVQRGKGQEASIPAGMGYPLGQRGRLIGFPNQGTHTIGNWESDNAVDIKIPEGTPVYAVAAGVIGSQIGSLGSSNPRMAGLRLHLVTHGNEFYYAHLSRLAVQAGQHVKAGQLLGYSGSANGVAHLHIGSRNGNPAELFGS